MTHNASGETQQAVGLTVELDPIAKCYCFDLSIVFLTVSSLDM